MSRRVMKPVAQVKLTNVSVVRLKKGGKRFEIACYKNKILEWRSRVEKDLDNVLQIKQVFLNVSKGQVASKEDLLNSFQTESVDDAVMQILEKGDIQVGEKERTQQFDNMYRDIATIVAEKSVNPETKRPYTVTMIEKALNDIHFSVNPNKGAKQQAIEAIKTLNDKNTIPISRAQMRVRIIMPAKDGKRLKDKIAQIVTGTKEEDWSDEYELICVIDPGCLRKIGDLFAKRNQGPWPSGSSNTK
ncbi:SBDS family rRNA metabolism protein [Batrachochytrium salamandrivorans]|nr:SBDS family rRNA metabolism protein [Batrachochytrium salamandrivorans]